MERHTSSTHDSRRGLVGIISERFLKLRTSRVARRALRNSLLLTGMGLFTFVFLLGVFADFLAITPYDEVQMRHRFEPPSAAFPFGTDNFGRDIFSRVVYGARISLQIGLSVVVLSGILGVIFGTLAGYFPRLDNVIMRVMDALLAFPEIILAIAIAATLGPSTANAIIALAVVYTPRTARVVRASVLVIRQMDYVTAAICAGATDMRILRRHVFPNTLAPLVVQLTFIFAYAVIAEAVLSFLGIGAVPPTPTWGNIIAEGRNYIREATWISLFPGLAIGITVLGLNLLGDGLRDVLDPRMKVRHG
ncbi:MAG: ABC transporter permease [Nitratireductor sp.]